jgi:hypothetical protein
MEVGGARTDNDQKRPDEKDPRVNVLCVVFEQMHENWGHHEKQSIAELKLRNNQK